MPPLDPPLVLDSKWNNNLMINHKFSQFLFCYILDWTYYDKSRRNRHRNSNHKFYMFSLYRTQGLAFNIVTSRLGAAISPFINNLDLIHPSLPFLVITIVTSLALFLCVFLPETLGKPTRERFEDIFDDD